MMVNVLTIFIFSKLDKTHLNYTVVMGEVIGNFEAQKNAE